MMIAAISYPVALTVSLLWFGAAFRYFSYQNMAAAKVMVPKSARHSAVFPTLGAALRFLGGMNAALALMSLILLIIWASDANLFINPIERGVLLLILATAHFSQFAFNIPILRNGERHEESFWYVKSGPMYFIFVMDALQALVNAGAGLIQFWA